MTEFSDVNVGDKVRLTRAGKPNKRNEFEVAEASAVWLKDDEGVAYDERDWSVEVLEPAPKPLPTTRGFYTRPDGTELWKLGVDDLWRQNTFSGGWVIAGDNRIPRDLMPLVPYSAVEEARAAVVKEIVERVRYHTPHYVSHKVLADGIERSFRAGGKA